MHCTAHTCLSPCPARSEGCRSGGQRRVQERLLSDSRPKLGGRVSLCRCRADLVLVDDQLQSCVSSNGRDRNH